MFIQTFSECADYSKKSFCDGMTNTGINQDKYCNIHDMSGNFYEWSTETYSRSDYSCAYRGGNYNDEAGHAGEYTSYRGGAETTRGGLIHSFRTLLYVAL